MTAVYLVAVVLAGFIPIAGVSIAVSNLIATARAAREQRRRLALLDGRHSEVRMLFAQGLISSERFREAEAVRAAAQKALDRSSSDAAGLHLTRELPWITVLATVGAAALSLTFGNQWGFLWSFANGFTLIPAAALALGAIALRLPAHPAAVGSTRTLDEIEEQQRYLSDEALEGAHAQSLAAKGRTGVGHGFVPAVTAKAKR